MGICSHVSPYELSGWISSVWRDACVLTLVAAGGCLIVCGCPAGLLSSWTGKPQTTCTEGTRQVCQTCSITCQLNMDYCSYVCT